MRVSQVTKYERIEIHALAESRGLRAATQESPVADCSKTCGATAPVVDAVAGTTITILRSDDASAHQKQSAPDDETPARDPEAQKASTDLAAHFVEQQPDLRVLETSLPPIDAVESA